MTRILVVILSLLTFLPVASILPGGELDPDFAARTLEWLMGIALCLGVGAIAAILTHASSRGDAHSQAPASITTPPRAIGSSSWVGWPFAIGLTGLAGVGYAVIAWGVFSGRPLLIDEVVQVWQARIYASGRLSIPTDSIPSLTSISHVVDLGPRTFAQFPAGGPAMLALGTLLGAEWLVNPLAGALCVLLFARLLRTLEPTASVRWHRGTSILFAIAPFGLFMFGSHMNHVTTLLWLLVALVALARVTEMDVAAPVWGVVVGLGLGIAATIRPLDGMIFALPVAGWLLWRVRRSRGAFGVLLAAGIGVAVPLGGLLWVNAATTGHPLLFGYDLLWGADHRLGFHRSPWGFVHTPARGVELISLYLGRLSTALFEAPFPSVLPAFIALWRLPRRTGMDHLLLISMVGVLFGYGLYWHDGNFLGPRFLVPLLPFMIVWTARFALIPWHWTPRRRAGVRWALGASVLLSMIELVAVRVPTYQNSFTSLRQDYAAEANAAGVQNAVVLVRESWGAETIARMWALGVPRADAEQTYRRADLCMLDEAVHHLERSEIRGRGAVALLKSIWVDTTRLVTTPYSVDRTQLVVPGTMYPPSCLAAIRADQAGFANFTPLTLVRDGNTYLRYIRGTEAEIFRRAGDRPIFVMSRAGPAVNAPVRFTRLVAR
jgi:hypothetical protein